MPLGTGISDSGEDGGFRCRLSVMVEWRCLGAQKQASTLKRAGALANTQCFGTSRVHGCTCIDSFCALPGIESSLPKKQRTCSWSPLVIKTPLQSPLAKDFMNTINEFFPVPAHRFLAYRLTPSIWRSPANSCCFCVWYHYRLCTPSA